MRWTMVAAGLAVWVILCEPAAAQLPERPAPLGSVIEEVTLGGSPVSLEELLAHAARSAPALAVAEAEVDLADADFGLADPLLPGNPYVQAAIGARLQRSSDSGMDLNVQIQLLQPIEIAGQRPLRFDVARAARATRDLQLERHADIVLAAGTIGSGDFTP